jgi:putative membrane protein
MAVVIVPLKRILIPKKIKARMVMINALATFQKAGISLTRNRTGLLIYYSQFEQIVQVVADEGVKRNLPVKEIEHIDEIFSNIHRQKNPVLAFIGQVINLKEILSKYLPTTPDDINELPDNLDINL